MADVAEMPARISNNRGSETNLLEALGTVIATFREKYPRSQDLKTDLERFVGELEERCADFADRETVHKERLSVIERHLKIDRNDAGDESVDDRLLTVVETLQEADDAEPADLAFSCRRLIDEDILTEPDLRLRPVIEAFAQALANFTAPEEFYKIARRKIKICA